MSVAEVSAATGISKKRIIGIEQGEFTPDEDECIKIAKLYNVPPEKMSGTLNDAFKSIMNEPIDASFYKNYIVKEVIEEKITSLNDSERAVVMKLRQAENKEELIERIMNLLSE